MYIINYNKIKYPSFAELEDRILKRHWENRDLHETDFINYHRMQLFETIIFKFIMNDILIRIIP